MAQAEAVRGGGEGRRGCSRAQRLFEGRVSGAESVAVAPDGTLVMLDKFGISREHDLLELLLRARGSWSASHFSYFRRTIASSK